MSCERQCLKERARETPRRSRRRYRRCGAFCDSFASTRQGENRFRGRGRRRGQSFRDAKGRRLRLRPKPQFLRPRKSRISGRKGNEVTGSGYRLFRRSVAGLGHKRLVRFCTPVGGSETKVEVTTDGFSGSGAQEEGAGFVPGSSLPTRERGDRGGKPSLSGFSMPVFSSCPKADDKWHPLLDLSLLIGFCGTHFRMRRSENWTTPINLQDAGFRIGIQPSSRKWMRFMWEQRAFGSGPFRSGCPFPRGISRSS
jgi:hypothetical protein